MESFSDKFIYLELRDILDEHTNNLFGIIEDIPIYEYLLFRNYVNILYCFEFNRIGSSDPYLILKVTSEGRAFMKEYESKNKL